VAYQQKFNINILVQAFYEERKIKQISGVQNVFNCFRFSAGGCTAQ
jgi:hypothetical protein